MNSTERPAHVLNTWRMECENAIKVVEDVYVSNFEYAGDVAIEAARLLMAVAFRLKGVACPKCYGRQRIAYPNTATWRSQRGMVSGQAVTEDVCNECWGSGRTDEKGVDLLKLWREQHG